MKLTDYSHNRKVSIKEAGDDFYEQIEKFGNNKNLDSFYNHYKKKYSIPRKVLKQSLKKNIVQNYNYKKSAFRNVLKLSKTPFSIVKYFGFLILALLYSKKNRRENKYQLIIDEIDHELYLKRFSRLIDLFGEEQVLIINTGNVNQSKFPNRKITNLHLYKNHDFRETLRTIYNEILFGFWVTLKSSILMRTNLFQQSFFIIKTVLQYKFFFKNNISKYLFQERLYTTNAIKNYLFKKSGGIATTVMQKSLLELCKMSYYIDIDYFFSIGNRTAERAVNYGGKIGKIIPVGSLFMNYYWFNNPKAVEKKIDLIMLGINIMNEYERFDKYDGFMDDYYETFKWLVKFNFEYPEYSIRIKHHSSAGKDSLESEILSGSNIEILPQNGNSYEHAFQSRCIVTYGSTIGYEMIAHGVPSFFLAPRGYCSFIPDPDDDLLDGLRITTYKSFKNNVLSTLKKENTRKIKTDDFCLNSAKAFENVFNNLI